MSDNSNPRQSRIKSRFSPLSYFRMLLVATKLGSLKARGALTLILFLLIWLLLSIPDAFAASSGTRASSFTYNPASGLLETETVEPGDAAFELTTAYGYDGYGNKLSATTSGADIVTRTTSTVYDAKGRFATSVTNALGHSETWTHDARFGVPLTQTGPNSLTTTWQYDSFGRKTLEIRADGNRTAFAYEYCSGVAGGTAVCPTRGAYVITATPQNAGGAQNGPLVKTFHDTHGRAIQTESQGFSGAAVFAETVYDSFGRVLRESRPFFAGAAKQWTTYAYDALGRVTGVTLPDNSSASFAFNGLTTSTTNDKSQTETTVKNARGEVVAVTDANGKTVTYAYGPFGVRTSITDMAGNVIVNAYDKAGRKTASTDPDLGHWTYAYNVLGELVSQTDAKSQTSTMTYDKLGRPLTRVEPDGTSSWTYDTAVKGVGKLATASHTNGYLRTQTYDSLGRPSSTATRIDGVTETSSVTYDADGRLDRMTYPSGFAVEHVYTPLGYMSQLNEAGGGALWTANVMDAELRLTQATLGNGVTVWRTFDSARGFITDIEAGAGNAVADFGYTFDTLGNLTYRVDSNESLAENFQYDVLNRLTSYQIAGQTAKTVTYDDLGNITSKSDVGTYTYAASGAGSIRPHAVQSITGTLNTNYVYDDNGNMTSGSGRTLTWTSFNKVASIAQGAVNMTYAYGPERQRITQTGPGGTTYYYSGEGALYEKHVGASVTQWNEYLYAGGEMVGVHFSRSDATEMTRYFVKDHLGSIAVITDEAGAVTERLSYDAWGKRRYPNGADDPTGILTAQTTRGFTGHEMIDDVDLVNMNGRIYDPQIGRFLSPDPFIQDVTNSQNLNRYTYVNNNPLSYTDPSGYFFKKLFRGIGKFFKKFWKPLLAIAAAFALQFYALPALAGAGTGIGAFGSLALPTQIAISGISAGVSNVIMTGRPKSFLAGFGQGALTFGVGSAFSGGLGKVVAHGVIGGAFDEIRGGSFKSGFLAAGFSSAAGSIDFKSVPANLIKSAVAGGTGSVLGGGKFANGAVTGSFTYILNDLSHRQFKRQASRVLGVLEEYSGINFAEASDAVLSEIDARLPKWARTLFSGVSGSVNAGFGGTAGAGTYWDRRTGEYGAWDMQGLGVGINLGATPIIGFVTGSADDFCCYFEQYEVSKLVNVGYMRGLAHRPVYRDGRYISDRTNVHGGYIGGGEIGAAVSVTYTNVHKLGIRH